MADRDNPHDVDTPEHYAYELGADHGVVAQSWIDLEGDEQVRRLRDGIEACDPEIMDSLPYPDLSGQWADSLTGPRLVADAITWADSLTGPMLVSDAMPDEYTDEERADRFTSVCDAYEDGFRTAMERALSARITRYLLDR